MLCSIFINTRLGVNDREELQLERTPLDQPLLSIMEDSKDAHGRPISRPLTQEEENRLLQYNEIQQVAARQEHIGLQRAPPSSLWSQPHAAHPTPNLQPLQYHSHMPSSYPPQPPAATTSDFQPLQYHPHMSSSRPPQPPAATPGLSLYAGPHSLYARPDSLHARPDSLQSLAQLNAVERPYTFTHPPTPGQHQHAREPGSLAAAPYDFSFTQSFQSGDDGRNFAQSGGLQQTPFTFSAETQYNHTNYNIPQGYVQLNQAQQAYPPMMPQQPVPASSAYQHYGFTSPYQQPMMAPQQPTTASQQPRIASEPLTMASQQHTYNPGTQQQWLPPVIQQPAPARNVIQQSPQTMTTFPADQQWFWSTDTQGMYTLPNGTQVQGTYAQIYNQYPHFRTQFMELYDNVNEFEVDTTDGAADDSGATPQQPVMSAQAAKHLMPIGHGGESMGGTTVGEPLDDAGGGSAFEMGSDGGGDASDGISEQWDDYADITLKEPLRSASTPAQPSPPNVAADFIRTIIDGTRQQGLTLPELQSQHLTTPDLRGALLVAINEGIFQNLPNEPTAQSQEIVGRWWRLQSAGVDSVEMGRLWRQDVLNLIVECCQDLATLRADGDEDEDMGGNVE
ncbi:hypothetical protein LTR85_006726 [Meristemomyces frigidus]|nr:hypothetical protein LTR85_006726 [Meristemomyces frigidus]